MLDDPFEMFCLYYLGLNPQGEYRFHNANQIAREHNWSVQELLRHLSGMNLHPDQVVNTDFPLARYQVDVQIAAETSNGLQLRSLARKIYEEFLRARGRPRDWLGEIEQERHDDNKPPN
jgi:hypothetical protein